jgi:hypothetical protein
VRTMKIVARIFLLSYITVTPGIIPHRISTTFQGGHCARNLETLKP